MLSDVNNEFVITLLNPHLFIYASLVSTEKRGKSMSDVEFWLDI